MKSKRRPVGKPARRKPVQRNPLLPRIRYVAKQYPNAPYVTMATIAAWAEATGNHDLPRKLARELDKAGLPEVLKYLDTHVWVGELAESSRFDKYLPWLAREIYKSYKGVPTKTIETEAGVNFAWPENIRRDNLRVSARSAGDGPLSANTLDLADTTVRFIQQFSAVVDWAEDERIDLNRTTWAEAVDEAWGWAEQRGEKYVEQGKVVYEFPDGWTVQELKTQSQFATEGKAMQHCLGSYNEKAVGEQYRIFSLRDPGGHPHATMEWNLPDKYAQQLKGKQNVAPVEDYLVRMAAFRRDVLDQGRAPQAGSSVSALLRRARELAKTEEESNEAAAAEASQLGDRALEADWEDAIEYLKEARDIEMSWHSSGTDWMEALRTAQHQVRYEHFDEELLEKKVEKAQERWTGLSGSTAASALVAALERLESNPHGACPDFDEIEAEGFFWGPDEFRNLENEWKALRSDIENTDFDRGDEMIDAMAEANISARDVDARWPPRKMASNPRAVRATKHSLKRRLMR